MVLGEPFALGLAMFQQFCPQFVPQATYGRQIYVPQ